MATGLLDETQDGKVCHNPCSAMILSRPHLLDIVGFMSEFTSKASTRLIDSMERDPSLQEPNTTGFNLAFQTDENFLLHLESNIKSAAMFGGTMKGMVNNPGFSHDHMVHGYKWEELGNATVVDVGGSSGHTCVALAGEFPSLKFVIQDLASAMEHAEDNIPDEGVRSRVEFMTHDFFTPQPHIPDAKILRNLTAGMAPGSSIIIAEVIVPPLGVLPWPDERFIASQDIIMMLLHNSQERTLDEYKQLMGDASPKLRYVNHTTPENSIMSFIEFRFN